MKKPRRKIGRRVAIVLLVVALGGLGFAYFRTDLSDASSSYNKNRAAAVQAGLFMTTDDVQKFLECPKEDNGAKEVLDATDFVTSHEWTRVGKATDDVFLKSWPQFQSNLDSLEFAVPRKHLRIPLDYPNHPVDSMFPVSAYTKLVVIVLCRRASLAEKANDPQTADKLLTLASQISAKYQDQGTLQSALVRISFSARVEEVLKNIIKNHGKDLAWQVVVQHSLQQLDQPFDIRTNLKFEHWFLVTLTQSYSTMHNLAMVMGEGEYLRGFQYLAHVPTFTTANLSRIHQHYAVAMSKLSDDPTDLDSATRAVEYLDQTAQRQELSYSVLNTLNGITKNSIKGLKVDVARRNALAQALQLCITKQDPASGLPLKGRFQTDADGNLLRLAHDQNGWRIYSVGSDLEDNGGVEKTSDKIVKRDYVIYLPQ